MKLHYMQMFTGNSSIWFSTISYCNFSLFFCYSFILGFQYSNHFWALPLLIIMLLFNLYKWVISIWEMLFQSSSSNSIHVLLTEKVHIQLTYYFVSSLRFFFKPQTDRKIPQILDNSKLFLLTGRELWGHVLS